MFNHSVNSHQAQSKRTIRGWRKGSSRCTAAVRKSVRGGVPENIRHRARCL